jgi:hypothetical protein
VEEVHQVFNFLSGLFRRKEWSIQGEVGFIEEERPLFVDG